MGTSSLRTVIRGSIKAQASRLLAKRLDADRLLYFVALTGESVRFENHAPALHRSFDVYCSRIGRPEDLKVAILFRDITQREQAEEALRESEARAEEEDI